MTAFVTAPPAIEPVSVAEARAHLRVTSAEEDPLIARLIVAARSEVERRTRRALIAQSWRLYLDRWPAGRVVRLPVTPVAAVTAVTVYDEDGIPGALDPDAYQLDGKAAPARLRVAAGVPGSGGRFNGIEIDFTAGYGPAADDVPAPLIQAVLLLVAHWYEHREAGVEVATAHMPFGFSGLVAGYRVPRL